MMKEQYDFSSGERGKFYSSEAVFSFPVYLEPDVEAFLGKLAEEEGIDVQQLVNEWLRANIRLIESIQPTR